MQFQMQANNDSAVYRPENFVALNMVVEIYLQSAQKLTRQMGELVQVRSSQIPSIY